MKTKLIYYIFCIISLIVFVSCDDYLDTKSKSELDKGFVFASETEAEKTLLGVYGSFQSYGGIHSSGLFYDVIATGSDIELGPENPQTGGGRYLVANLYPNDNLSGVANISNNGDELKNNTWNSIYHIINRCNIIIKGLENSDVFINADKTKPSKITQFYGEAVALRATLYYELTRIYGDVIYSEKPFVNESDYLYLNVLNRDEIQEKQIEALKIVEPMMYYLGNYNAERMTRGYVQGLIGRMALLRGGYSLRPASYTPQSGDEIKQMDATWGKLVRRGDYKNYYTIAKQYLELCRDNSKAKLITTDTRKSPNPFQLVFQKMMDLEVSEEAIFEIGQSVGIHNERPYAFGRPSSPSSNTGYPGKAYGQMRFYPTFYYDEFNPKDLRRDVTVAVTANNGLGSEILISLRKGNKEVGGLALNKWDQSRMKNPAASSSRQTGINAPYMRYADILLLLAETYYVLGDESAARAELLKVRSRAFDPSDADYGSLVTNYVNGKSGLALLEAIQDERKFELAGEGIRKFDLIRWGNFGEKINNLQNRLEAMVQDLENSGQHTFSNGNTISTYIWTKKVLWKDSKSLGLIDMLTQNCDVVSSDPLYPIKFPGWRGNYSLWKVSDPDKVYNIAIQGLFKPLTSTEINVLEADGYVKTNWGSDIVNQKEFWLPQTGGIFGGYLPADYTANKPPRYILPLPPTEISKAHWLKNEYGFPDAF